jgi:hypothetical protein
MAATSFHLPCALAPILTSSTPSCAGVLPFYYSDSSAKVGNQVALLALLTAKSEQVALLSIHFHHL